MADVARAGVRQARGVSRCAAFDVGAQAALRPEIRHEIKGGSKSAPLQLPLPNLVRLRPARPRVLHVLLLVGVLRGNLGLLNGGLGRL